MGFTLETIRQEAEAFANEYLQEGRVVAFYAKMGVGKTTFIKELCNVLQVVDTINSPTFAIVNEYSTATNGTLYHFDFYRIKDIHEAVDFGAEEYFYSGNTCLIEWPELVEPILPDDYLEVEIRLLENDERELVIKDK
jgi:tRNA threonylcarbamoyladenosine biosynthesis protein TsaE